MKFLLIGYEPDELDEEDLEKMSAEEIRAIPGLWINEVDLKGTITQDQLENIVSDVQCWAEKGGLTYVKRIE